MTTIVTLVIASVEFTLVAGFLAGITQMSIETGDDVYKKLMALAKVKYMMLISPGNYFGHFASAWVEFTLVKVYWMEIARILRKSDGS